MPRFVSWGQAGGVMTHPNVLKLLNDFQKPVKPKDWKQYDISGPSPESTQELRAIFEKGRVRIVHCSSQGDYHVQTQVGRFKDLNIQRVEDKIRQAMEKGRGQLPEPAPEDD